MSYSKEEPETIRKMFGSIARRYDLGNSILSMRMHKRWNSQLVSLLGKEGTLLDLCCGTGEIGFASLERRQGQQRLYMLDFCPEMLACAKEKAARQGYEKKGEIVYLQADAQKIPLPDSSVERCSVAYGIRNVKEPALCFQEVARVLKPGGRFGVLELTRPKNRLMRTGHRLYMRLLLPVVGKLLTSDKEAYRYLCQSVDRFIPAEELEKMLSEAGFIDIRRRPLTGGIATLIVAEKPSIV